MINELYDLWNACEQCHIAVPSPVPGFSYGKKQTGFRVFLTLTGAISAIELVPADRMERIRKWGGIGGAAGIDLPVFNFEPLHDVDPTRFSQLKKDLKGGKILTVPSSVGELRWSQSKVDDLARAFSYVADDIRRTVEGNADSAGAAWQALVTTILPNLDPKMFLGALSACIVGQLTLAPASPSDEMLCLLFHPAGRQSVDRTPVQFDVAGQDCPIYSREAEDWLAKQLLQRVATFGDDNKKAIWGNGRGFESEYEKVKVPILGEVSLYNKNSKDRPTCARYGQGKAVSFPLGNDVRIPLMGAAEWLFSTERRGKTWTNRNLPSGGPFLLAAYPTFLSSDVLPELAALFCGPDEEEGATRQVRFEDLSQNVVQAIDGIIPKNAVTDIRVFALNKHDKGRAQVLCSYCLDACGFLARAKAWRADMREYPAGIRIRQFDSASKTPVRTRRTKAASKESKPVPREPEIPFPYQVVECLNTVWYRGGNDATEAADVGLQDAFQLLLTTDEGTYVSYLVRLLDLALRRSLPFMLAVGQAGNYGRVFVPQPTTKKDVAKTIARSRFQPLRWPCIMGFFLSRLGFKKEVYVNEPAFLIGRMLSLTDSLHSYYAKHVSKKTEMPQLLGNSLMSVAMERPQDAFVLLGQRILPYQAWAYSYSRGKGDDCESVGKILGAMSKVAAQLAETQVPEEIGLSCAPREGSEGKKPAKDILGASSHVPQIATQAAKAQMLLGYLARGGAATSADSRTAGEGDAFGFDNERGGQS